MTPPFTRPDWKALVRAALDRITGDPAHDEDIVEELAQDLAQRFDDQLLRGVPRDRALQMVIAELADPSALSRSLRDSARTRPIAPVPPIVGGKPSMWNVRFSASKNPRTFSEARLHAVSSRNMYSEQL